MDWSELKGGEKSGQQRVKMKLIKVIKTIYYDSCNFTKFAKLSKVAMGINGASFVT